MDGHAWLDYRKAPAADDALRFLDHEQVIGRQILKRLLRARWPADFDRVRSGRATQAEMQPQVVLRIVAGPAHHLVDLGVRARGDLYARPNRRAVGTRADALDQNRVVARLKPRPRITAAVRCGAASAARRDCSRPHPRRRRCRNRQRRSRGPDSAHELPRPLVADTSSNRPLPEIAIDHPRLPVREVQLAIGDL